MRDRQRDRVDGQFEKIGQPRGDVACFSFHPRKVMSTGDGGMLTTANPDWACKVQNAPAARNERARHGPTWLASSHIRGAFAVLGYNYRMTDIQAAVGREQLKRLAGDRRQRAARSLDRYTELLANNIGLCDAVGARLCAQQLAKLLCAAADPLRPAHGHADDVGCRHCHTPRYHVQPPRSGLCQRALRVPLATFRSSPR